ncbi:hypothetical protein ANANG_G00115190 [Anguilla anguilla]|uniref:General transcription factor IIH subunit 5 n=2 Tax=Anguilla anguilla TaxID=7936 RepID=A0A9D3MDB5_ANGAN|nr:hypothetical protein ANANG_G00115190 [Anguilla anguilla]
MFQWHVFQLQCWEQRMSATALCLIRCRRLSTANQGLKKTLFWGNIKTIAKVTGAVVLGGCVFITYEVVSLNKAVTVNTQAILQEKRKSYIYLNTNLKEQENIASSLTYKTRKELHKAARRFLEISSKILLKPVDEHLSGLDADPHEYALWVLLKRTRAASRAERLQAVQELAEHTHWHDYQYRTAAQAVDHRTAIGLARTPQVDLRFFLSPPLLPRGGRRLLSRGQAEAAASVPAPGGGGPVHSVFHLARPEREQPIAGGAEGRAVVFRGKRVALRAEPDLGALGEGGVLLPAGAGAALKGPQSLRPHSCRRGPAAATAGVPAAEGLPKDPEEHRAHRGKPGPERQPAQCDSAVRVGVCAGGDDAVPPHHAGFARCQSPGQPGPGRCAREVPRRGVHPAPAVSHEPANKSGRPLRPRPAGGRFKTWRQQDLTEEEKAAGTRDDYTECWPKSWLAADCPHLRILSVEYDTHLSDWRAKCPVENQRKSLAYRSRELLSKLKTAGVGDKPVIWVAHSMGGLLVKKMLLDAVNDPEMQPLLKNTKGIMFYSVPHNGTFMAEYSVNVRYLLFPSIEVKELSRDSPALRELNENFLNMAQDRDIKILSFTETRPTNVGPMIKMVVVPEQSAELGIGDFIPVDVDHLNICKPEKKDSFLYKRSLQFIQDTLGSQLAFRFGSCAVALFRLDVSQRAVSNSFASSRQCRMVNVLKGVLVECDPAMKQFLLYLDETSALGKKFIIQDLDDTHVFIIAEVVQILQERVGELMDQNSFPLTQK